jgi:iron-sulfur cluster insertion protein
MNEIKTSMSLNMNPSSPTEDQNISVNFTDEAAMAALDLQAKTPEYQGLAVRVYIDGKGCDGFYYGVTFDAPSADDLKFEVKGLQVIIDSETLKYIRGSEISWVSDERGTGFLVSNPNHKKFKGKFFKREKWQERMASN